MEEKGFGPGRCMNETEVERRGYAWRAIRSVESLPFGPVWLGLGFAAGLIAVYLAWHATLDSLDWMFSPEHPFFVTPHNRTHLVVVVLIAFLLATTRYEGLRSQEMLRRCSAAAGLRVAY